MKKKQENSRKEDSIASVPRPFVFIITLVTTIGLTILCLHQIGLLSFQPKEQPLLSPPKEVVKYVPIENSTNIKMPNHSKDIQLLVNELGNMEYKYQKLQEQLEQQAVALQQKQEKTAVNDKIIPPTKHSPIELLNQLMINYNQGGNMNMILQYIVPYLETDLIQDYFQKLLDLTPEEGPITRFELLADLNDAINLPPRMVQNATTNKGFKEILSDLIVVRKKGEHTDEVKQNLIQIREKMMQNNIKELGEIFSSEFLKQDERLTALSEKIKTYLMQQQLLFAFKTYYLHHHLRQIE